MPDRVARLWEHQEDPLVIYTDASHSERLTRLGAKVLEKGQLPEVMIYDPEPDIARAWGDQKTVINQAELQCGALVAETFADRLTGRDVL